MSYFQLYEKRKNLYKKVQPGSVWKNLNNTQTVVVSSVNLSRGTIYGTWNSITLSGNDSIEWLLRFYHPVKE